MLIPVLLGLCLGTVCMVLHALGTAWWLRHQKHRYRDVHAGVGMRTLLSLLGMTLTVLTSLHVLQILIWAVAYRLIPEINVLRDLEEAVYFSLVTFTTVGYGDIVMEKGWRIMAGIEALNGILLLGWSTAVLLAVAQRFWRVRSEED